MGVIYHIVYASEMVRRFNNIVNVDRFFGKTYGIRFKDIPRFVVSKLRALNMI